MDDPQVLPMARSRDSNCIQKTGAELHNDKEAERTGTLEISRASCFREFSDTAHERIRSLSLGTCWDECEKTSGTAANTDGNCEGVTGSSGDLSVAAVNNGIEMSFGDVCTADRARSSGTGGDAEGSDLFEIPGM